MDDEIKYALQDMEDRLTRTLNNGAAILMNRIMELEQAARQLTEQLAKIVEQGRRDRF